MLNTANIRRALCVIAMVGFPFSILDSIPTTTAFAQKATPTWTVTFSDGKPPVTIPVNTLVSAMHCKGRYCDNLKLGYQAVHGVRHGTSKWGWYISEERPNNNYSCPGDGFMIGMACKGRYCDDIVLQCAPVGKKKGQCYWSRYFSEEDTVLYLRAGFYAAGVKCRGSHCDDKTVKACKAY